MPKKDEKQQSQNDWRLYRGSKDRAEWPEPPPWRTFSGEVNDDEYLVKPEKKRPFIMPSEDTIDLVNLAIYLRRPLLVLGPPGVGKTSLAYDIAYELNLGKVLEWSITSRTTLQQGLYNYDALRRLHEMAVKKDGEGYIPDETEIGKFIRLGPLGTALYPRKRPRVLLIDEFDKSDYDLPNDLLFVFERGKFEIPELKRIANKKEPISVGLHENEGDLEPVTNGEIECHEFPIVIITSNEERELPAAFMRRCIRLIIDQPRDEKQLVNIIKAHLEQYEGQNSKVVKDIVQKYLNRLDGGQVAVDQLLNATHLMARGVDLTIDEDRLLNIVLSHLDKLS